MSIRYVCALCESAVCVLSLQSSPWLFAWHEKNMLLPDMRPILYAHSMLIYCNIGRDPADIRSILYMYIYITSYACANASHDKCILYIHNIIVYFTAAPFLWLIQCPLVFCSCSLSRSLSILFLARLSRMYTHSNWLSQPMNMHTHAPYMHSVRLKSDVVE